MADQPTNTQMSAPTIACVHAHRLEDGRVLQTPEEHELHALEQEIAAESAASITSTPAPASASAPTLEDLTDG